MATGVKVQKVDGVVMAAMGVTGVAVGRGGMRTNFMAQVMAETAAMAAMEVMEEMAVGVGMVVMAEMVAIYSYTLLPKTERPPRTLE
ncbi:hypothetical protein SAMN05216299_106149 [Nitrosospira sp. Nsp14]|uniref:hypothetical protein n=1 Tax=Nitrosospira sp. Nsp14 TaxID=1855333 RepID=UPI0008ED0533|nr:hypothetical protein [Nitrosospira sp. Nsp14]SFH32182.1 hypothetical protein SAMN05216299_106149 [Nitrosospira sp. Nsp14]